MRKSLITALAIALTSVVAFALSSSSPAEPAQAKKVNHYIGAAKCKNCHSTPENGDQYGCWTKSKHAEAFKTLAGDEAKKLAAAKGIADPQKDEKCFKCHVTGFGLADDQFKKGFDKAGVQCEACHGPGASYSPADVMRDLPLARALGLRDAAASCKRCHVASTTPRPFDFAREWARIKH